MKRIVSLKNLGLCLSACLLAGCQQPLMQLRNPFVLNSREHRNEIALEELAKAEQLKSKELAETKASLEVLLENTKDADVRSRLQKQIDEIVLEEKRLRGEIIDTNAKSNLNAPPPIKTIEPDNSNDANSPVTKSDLAEFKQEIKRSLSDDSRELPRSSSIREVQIPGQSNTRTTENRVTDSNQANLNSESNVEKRTLTDRSNPYVEKESPSNKPANSTHRSLDSQSSTNSTQTSQGDHVPATAIEATNATPLASKIGTESVQAQKPNIVEATQASPLPNETVAPGEWKNGLADLIHNVELNLQQNSEKLSHTEKAKLEIYLRMMYLMASQKDKAVTPIAGLDANMSEYWREQLYALAELTKDDRTELESAMFLGAPQKNAIGIEHLRKAIDELSRNAMLQVRNAHMCQDVKGYGSYTEFTDKRFSKNQQVLIYCELENYVAEIINAGRGKEYETQIQCTAIIVDESSKIVRQVQYEKIIEKGQSRRRDFYLLCSLTIPDLPPGKYSVRLQVIDVKAGKETSSEPMPFEYRA